MHTYRRLRTHTACGVRTPLTVPVYTHAHFLVCLYTYGRSLTGIDEWRRSDAIATLGDGVCTLTARPDGMPTDATVCLHIETVRVDKSATTRARPRVYTTF